jgi:hypothetical protein
LRLVPPELDQVLSRNIGEKSPYAFGGERGMGFF